MMAANLWPWLAVAAMGALHGLNPATGWALGAWQARSGARVQLRGLLLPIAAGHGASVLVVAAAVPLGLQLGLEVDVRWAQAIAGALLLAVLLHHLLHRAPSTLHATPGRAGLALWSFIVGSAHGAGWMLVPALVPLCAGDPPARELTASGSAAVALAAVGVHLCAMLVTTAVMTVAAGVAQRRLRMRPGR